MMSDKEAAGGAEVARAEQKIARSEYRRKNPRNVSSADYWELSDALERVIAQRDRLAARIEQLERENQNQNLRVFHDRQVEIIEAAEAEFGELLVDFRDECRLRKAAEAEAARLEQLRLEAVGLIPHEIWNELPATTHARLTSGFCAPAKEPADNKRG